MSALAHAYVGLGANLGDRLQALRDAVDRLDGAAGVRVVACSPVYETAPQGPVRAQPAFLNAVCAVETSLAPRDLLGRLLQVERALGRVRDVPQGPRTIDLDLLLFGSTVVDEPGLLVPHRQLQRRAFVLVPLLDLAPDLRHPLTGELLREERARLRDQAIAPFAPPSALQPTRAPGPPS
ncbi:MAG: 2-amino-4-hydroxy-6-hydroxymethyldihydropteridine diphosphokinase [Deltaproteobacteria bacterium]|nr:2-amino-4-hydroxy-6-hydroxymethyldihydropteridine diphosphokinase [Deltaproteobacteria bacterium]